MGTTNFLERTATIFNIQKYNMYDGPGIRTLVFFQGCPLRCKWCANPEGLMKKYRLMYKNSFCSSCGECVEVCPVKKHKIDTFGKHIIDNSIECIGCRKCEEICINSALKIAGEKKKISELLKIIEEDRAFYETSGGGVTLGGGEVLMQPEAAISLLSACKNNCINTAIETCGHTTREVIEKVADYVDLFLFDLKHMDSEKHFYWTGVRNEQIIKNLEYLLENNYNVHIRLPLLKGVNDAEEDIEKLANFLKKYKDYSNLKGVDLLPYHKLGVNKYLQLGEEYQIKDDPSLKEEELKKIENCIKKYNLSVKIVRH